MDIRMNINSFGTKECLKEMKLWSHGCMAVWGLRRTSVAVFSYVKEIPHVLSCLASDLEHRCWVGNSHRDASLVHQPEGQSLE